MKRQRESVCERQSMVDGGGSFGCKTDCWRNFLQVRSKYSKRVG
jgi:hypothetical protein